MKQKLHISKHNLEKIRSFFSTQPVEKAWLFGSYARGEETRESDVDILVVFDNDVSLLKYASINGGLSRLLNKDVDLVSESALFPWVRQTVETERILIYERKTS